MNFKRWVEHIELIAPEGFEAKLDYEERFGILRIKVEKNNPGRKTNGNRI